MYPLSLRSLGFNSQTYSEVILTVKHKKTIHSTPVGVVLHREKLYIRLYRDSKIYSIFYDKPRDCTLSITRDPRVFYASILEREKIRYAKSKRVESPRIRGCNGYVECIVERVALKSEVLEATLKPVLVESRVLKAKTYNRAEPAIIEALVHLTKIGKRRETIREAEESLLKVKFCVETVYRSSKSRSLRRIARNVLREAEERYKVYVSEDRRDS